MEEENIIKPPALSIIISSHDHIKSLEKLLKQLYSQFRELLVYAVKAKDLIEDMELIIVDNSHNQSAADLLFKIIAEKKNFNLETRYIVEKDGSLSASRNRGIKESKGDTLLFLSDELELSTHWLKDVYDIAKLRTPSLICGAQVQVKWGQDLPDWLNLEPPFAISHSCFPLHDYGKQEKNYPFMIGTETNLLVENEYDNGDAPAGLYIQEPSIMSKLNKTFQDLTSYEVNAPQGACFLVSKDVFSALREFATDMGDVGAIRNLAEEMDFFSRAKQVGYQLTYQPAISVVHPIDAKLLTQKYLLEAHRRWGFMTAYTQAEQINAKTLKFKLLGLKILYYLSYLLIDPIKTFWLQTKIYELKGQKQGIGAIN